MIETLKDVAIIAGVPVLRSVAGWLTNALKDGKIDMIEWKLLGATVLRVGMQGVALYYGLGQVLDVPVVAAAFSAILTDKLFEALKPVVSKKK